MPTKLYTFQREDVDKIHAFNGRCLLASHMGLGKTLQVLTYMKEMPEPGVVVIVCPASLKNHWAREARKHLDMRVTILEGRCPHTGYALGQSKEKHELVIVNYDILQSWCGQLACLYPKLVVADECHALQSHTTIRTKAMQSLLDIANVPHFIAVSGTPIINRPIEFWPVLNMICPKKFPSFHAFGHKFCRPRHTRWGWEFKGSSKPKKLHFILNKYVMIRRLKKDVLKDLPDKQRIVVPMAIEEPQEYKKATKEFITWMKLNFGKQKADKAAQAEALVKIGYLRRLAARLKMKAVTEWVDEFLESGEKLILFGVHREMVEGFQKKYGKTACASVTGSVIGKDRQIEFDRFNADPKCVLFAGNLQAAGSGWSANACSTVAFLELCWSPGAHMQAEDRTHGINRGQAGMKSTAFYLVANGTIEEKLCDILLDKSKMIDSVVDGKEVEDMSVFDSLMKELREE